MTKEEAIKWIKEHHYTDGKEKDPTAMRMAIQALRYWIAKEVEDKAEE